MSRISRTAKRCSDFVGRHKVALTATTTAVITAGLVGQMRKSALVEAYEFIDNAGLMEKFVDSVPADEIYS